MISSTGFSFELQKKKKQKMDLNFAHISWEIDVLQNLARTRAALMYPILLRVAAKETKFL